MPTTDRWTSDHLLTEQGSKLYADQVRELFRRYSDEFEALAREVHGDMKADPIEGDGMLARRYHAHVMASKLYSMARHARAIVADAKAFEACYRRVCIELPKARADRAAKKELQKAGQALPSTQVNGLAAAIAHRASLPAQPGDHAGEQTPPAAPATPWAEMFKEAR